MSTDRATVTDDAVDPGPSVPWRDPLIYGGATVIALMLLSLFANPLLFRKSQWATPGDTWLMVRMARYVGNGALGYAFEADPGVTALPLFAILLAPAVIAGDALGLTQRLPYGIPHPTLWLIVGPWTMASGIVLLHAASELATALRPQQQQLRALLTAMCFLVLVPAFYAGHAEDLLAVAFGCYALRAAWRGDGIVRVALLMGTAIAFKQLALVFLPFVVLVASRSWRQRAAVLALSAVVPGALALVCLVADPEHARAALFDPRSQPAIGRGRVQPWVDANALSVPAGPARSAVLLIAVAIALFAVRRMSRTAIVSAVGIALGIRALFEPTTFPYYAAPAIAMLLVAAWAATGRTRVVASGAVIVLALYYLPLQGPSAWFLQSAATSVLLLVPLYWREPS